MGLTAQGFGWHERIRRLLSGSTAPAEANVQQLATFLDLVVTWNQKLDLTAARDDDQLCDLFLADAAVIARAAEAKPGEHWVDVGSGAGAPGLPLALLLPHTRWTLVEPQQKRVAFLRTALGTLGCDHVRVERARSEALPDAGFDVAISRATLSPEEWLTEGARLAHERVWLLLASSEPPQHPGFEVVHDIRYEWPLTRAPRRALCLVRTA
jgi:16S rRNA (guanine527-N7)-methyltransferase